MLLRRKPSSVDCYDDNDDERTRVEKPMGGTTIADYRKRKERTVIRYHWHGFGNNGSGQKYSDFALDLDWSDVINIITQMMALENGSPDRDNYKPKPHEQAMLDAITAIGKGLGIRPER